MHRGWRPYARGEATGDCLIGSRPGHPYNPPSLNDVVVRRPLAGERVQVATEGGTQAIWNPNGREVFYRADDKMIAVQVTTSPALKLSSPKVLFEGRLNVVLNWFSQRGIITTRSAGTPNGVPR